MATKSKPNRVRARECGCMAPPGEGAGVEGGLRLDRDRGIVYNVRVLGWEGINKNRRYDRAAVQEAVALYDGARVNLDHHVPNGSAATHRPVTSRFGRLRNPRVTDRGLVADLHYNPAHPFAPAFEWFVENDPAAIGLSHDAYQLEAPQPDGTTLVSKILRVNCVDLVPDPSTTQGLENVMDELTPLDTAAPDFSTKVGELVTAIMSDETLDKTAKRKKILKALDLLEDEAPPTPTPSPEGGESEAKEEKTEESVKPADLAKLFDKFATRVVEAVEGLSTKVTSIAKAKAPISHARENVTDRPVPDVKKFIEDFKAEF